MKNKIIVIILAAIALIYYSGNKKTNVVAKNPFADLPVDYNEERITNNPNGTRNEPFDSNTTDTRNPTTTVTPGATGTETTVRPGTTGTETTVRPETTGTTRHDREGKRIFTIR